MALHPKIEIKADGVAEVAMTDARAALTPFIREVSWGKRTGAFTERGKRVAVVVPPDAYEQAVVDRDVLQQLRERAEDPGPDAKPDDQLRARVLREELTRILGGYL
jgi:prevent-host-death family protein